MATLSEDVSKLQAAAQAAEKAIADLQAEVNQGIDAGSQAAIEKVISDLQGSSAADPGASTTAPTGTAAPANGAAAPASAPVTPETNVNNPDAGTAPAA